ncbi:FAD-dependent oxidoreductase [Xylanimonas allomyrinae]|uniref:FAD-dependent oxidoreductase n=1 Tax=Xylanimonas allomyrinae TaxID=2509459 RepID=UPI001B8822FA|nr:FAD-dependent oxidoreductase [Xylanimonas allomyrinae]
MTDDSSFTVDFTSPGLGVEGSDSYSVLRAELDPWLASKAEDAGADYITGIPVDELLTDGARVTGVRAGDDELTADVVILCDGVNSLLIEQAGLGATPSPHQVAVGVRQTFELPARVIEDRFHLAEGEGAAWLFVGAPTGGRVGGGFLYTNKDTVSVGLVATVSDLTRSRTPLTQLTEDFLRHPVLGPVLRDAKPVEYSAHLVPEGGMDSMPRLAGDGVLVAGDAAMMCLNLGYSVRGMDLAIAAGRIAGEQAARALDAGDTSAVGLAGYEAALRDSFVLKDMSAMRAFPHFMESTPRIFSAYPAMVRDICLSTFVVDGTPVEPLRRRVMRPVKQAGGLWALAKDGLRGMRAL